MAEDRDQMALARFVRELRHVARLAAADPLRFLPPDPLIRLASLVAPVARLLDAAPLETLRRRRRATAPPC
jgi:hypothetical protein